MLSDPISKSHSLPIATNTPGSQGVQQYYSRNYSELISIAARPKVTATLPITILLIDDQPIIAESIRRLLASEADFQFHYCNDPQQALPMAMELSPTVILQDLVMPNVDGLALVKGFRNNPVTQDIPIIVLSNREEATLKAEAFAMGANDYLVKLPDPIELIARLRYHSTAYINLLKRDEAERTLAYNQELERRVEERTGELQEALANLKQTQGQLIHNEKMTSLGQLVAGIAHEINNPVNFIAGNLGYVNQYVQGLIELVHLYQSCYPEPAEILTDKCQEIELDFINQDLPKVLSSLEIGTERIHNLVLSLKNFSRFDEAQVKWVNLHEGIDSTLLILQPKLKGIEVVKDYGELPQVECFPGQLNQVFMNILANAADALREKHSCSDEAQSPTVAATANVDLKTLTIPQIRIQTECTASNQIRISITDNGSGILPEVQNRIFDPFFTTKTLGEGTGLGLSISHQIIVEKHQGQLQCHSQLGQGSTFVIQIPLHQTYDCPQFSANPAS